MARLHKGFKSAVQHVRLSKKGVSFNIHKGRLHRALGIPEGEKIGQKRINKALKSKKPAIRRMARSAKGVTHMG